MRTYPGHIFRHGKPGWQTRLQVTERSMAHALMRALTDWKNQIPQTRRKLTKKDAEEHAEYAALVEAIYQDSSVQSNVFGLFVAKWHTQ